MNASLHFSRGVRSAPDTSRRKVLCPEFVHAARIRREIGGAAGVAYGGLTPTPMHHQCVSNTGAGVSNTCPGVSNTRLGVSNTLR
jgi:hypothetical protein